MFGVVVAEVDGFGDFRVALSQRLAGFGAHDFEQVGAAGLHFVAGAVEHVGALVWGEALPHVGGFLGGVVDLVEACGVFDFRCGYGVFAEGAGWDVLEDVSAPESVPCQVRVGVRFVGEGTIPGWLGEVFFVAVLEAARYGRLRPF